MLNCECGFREDRDTKAARTIVCMGLDQFVPTECRDIKPVEILTSGIADKYELLFDNSKLESLNQEAVCFSRG